MPNFLLSTEICSEQNSHGPACPWSLYSGVGGKEGGQGQDTALGSTLLKKMKAQSESCENQERGEGRCSGDKG